MAMQRLPGCKKGPDQIAPEKSEGKASLTVRNLSFGPGTVQGFTIPAPISFGQLDMALAVMPGAASGRITPKNACRLCVVEVEGRIPVVAIPPGTACRFRCDTFAGRFTGAGVYACIRCIVMAVVAFNVGIAGHRTTGKKKRLQAERGQRGRKEFN